MKKNVVKRGISLILLVITIIVVLILAGAVILSLSQNNPINSASEANFKTSLDSYKSELSMYLANEYAKSGGKFDSSTVYASNNPVTYPGEVNIKTIIPSMSDAEANNYTIFKGKLMYTGSDKLKRGFAKETILPDTYVKDGLILWLSGRDFPNTPLNKTWIDRSGNNNHGIVTNFEYNSLSGSDGNGNVKFDGSNDYIDFVGIDLSTLTSGTVSFWRKSSEVKYWLLFKGDSIYKYLLATHPTHLAFYNGSAGTGSVIYVDGQVASTPIDDGSWHHYLITNINISSWTSLTLSNYSSMQYHSLLGDLKIYNVAFSASDALNNFNAEKSTFGY